MSIGLKICKTHKGICYAVDRIDKVICDVGEVLTADGRIESVNNAAKMLGVMVEASCIVTRSPKLVNLVAVKTEDVDVVLAAGLVDLYVSTVHSTHSNRTVHHKLHTAGTAGLLTCKRDLLGDISRRNKHLCKRYVVLLHKYDLDLVTGKGISLKLLREEPDKLDKLLRHNVAGSSLTAEDEGLGRNIRIGIIHNLGIKRHNLQHVKELTLVLVHSLDLYVEDRVGINTLARLIVCIISEVFLIVMLDIGNSVENCRIVLILGKSDKLASVILEALADNLAKKLGKCGVGVVEPSSVNYAVGNVGELPGSHLIEIVEDGLLKNIAVKLGNAVYGVRADDRKVCHSYLVVSNDSHTGDSVPVTGIEVPEISGKSAVDLVYDHKDSGQLHTEQVESPAFKCLGKNGVVGIGHRLNNNAPGIVPAVAVLVHKDSHKLGNNKCGMSIVDVKTNVVLKAGKRAVSRKILVNNVLKRCRNEEILLSKTEKLTLVIVIRGIKLLCNRLSIVIGREILNVRALSSVAGSRPCNRLCSPEADNVNRVGVGAGNKNIVGYGTNLVVLIIIYGVLAVLPLFLDLAAKFNGDDSVGSGNKTNAAGGKPLVRELYLLALNYLLAEEAVFVKERIAFSKVVLCGKRVHKAGRKSAETAVAEAGINLAGINLIEGGAEFLKHLTKLVIDAEVHRVILKCTANEELHTEIADPLAVGSLGSLLELLAVLEHYILHSKEGCLVELLGSSLHSVEDTTCNKLRFYAFLKLFFCNFCLFT